MHALRKTWRPHQEHTVRSGAFSRRASQNMAWTLSPSSCRWPVRQLFVAGTVLSMGVVDCQDPFHTRDSLQGAVNHWCANETEARRIYGDIGTWNLQHVTNLNLLFNDKFDFNADISSWDVSHVTSMVRLLIANCLHGRS